jgi:hypothetical protein
VGDGDLGDGDSGDGDGSLGGSITSLPWEYPDDITFDYTTITGGGETCGSVEGAPESISRPIDIIFIIDNSGSMSDQIREVEENVKTNFADIIDASAIDYRVIMISRYGSSTGPGVGGSDYQFDPDDLIPDGDVRQNFDIRLRDNDTTGGGNAVRH